MYVLMTSDFALITETWFSDKKSDTEISVPGYHLFWLDRRCRIGLYLHMYQAVGGRPPRYAPPLSSPVGAEAPSAAEQTAT